MRVSKSSTVYMPYNITVGDLLSVLDGLPKDAKVSVHTTPRDRPWDSEQHRLEISWTEGV